MNPSIPDLDRYCVELASAARGAARQLAASGGGTRTRALAELAQRLRAAAPSLLAANERDLAGATANGLSAAQCDRLRLTPARVAEMVRAVEEIIALPDPIGRVIEGSVRPNGLAVQKVRVPLGVILFIYESRPNVTTDAAALCLKSGNAIILRGGKEAIQTNRAIVDVIRQAIGAAGLPAAAVTLVETTDRAALDYLLQLNDLINLVIPRGGEELIRRVEAAATMPVLRHYKGVCHIYVDADADAAMAAAIVENAKCQRPGVCNAAETLLVHQAVAAQVLPIVADVLLSRGVEMRGCPRTLELVPEAKPAKPEDFGTEFLALVLAVKVVDDLEDAIDHIARYGSGHTDAIVTNNLAAAQRFVGAVDSSAVMVNASTRFNDGGQLGLGAEIGISTDKFHARGPCGLNELTSYKYIVIGSGQVRD